LKNKFSSQGSVAGHWYRKKKGFLFEFLTWLYVFLWIKMMTNAWLWKLLLWSDPCAPKMVDTTLRLKTSSLRNHLSVFFICTCNFRIIKRLKKIIFENFNFLQLFFLIFLNHLLWSCEKGVEKELINKRE